MDCIYSLLYIFHAFMVTMCGVSQIAAPIACGFGLLSNTRMTVAKRRRSLSNDLQDNLFASQIIKTVAGRLQYRISDNNTENNQTAAATEYTSSCSCSGSRGPTDGHNWPGSGPKLID